MRPDAEQLQFEIPTPLLYVASQLSTLEGDAIPDMERYCRVAADTARASAKAASPSWELLVYCPIEESAPWKSDGRTPEEVYETNFSKVTQEADGVIVIGRWGGSFGAGQELAWAANVRLPILFLRFAGDKLSRQVEGTPANIEIVEFSTEEELADAVQNFVTSRRVSIEAHARHRRARTLEVMGLFEALQERYAGLGAVEKKEVSVISGVHERRLGSLATDPQVLFTASLDELLALTGALDVNIGQALSPIPLPDLTAEELAALRVAAAEWDWSGPKTITLMQAARLERAKGGTRRLRMSTPQDWNRFDQRFVK
jgi:hypothetical protein